MTAAYTVFFGTPASSATCGDRVLAGQAGLLALATSAASSGRRVLDRLGRRAGDHQGDLAAHLAGRGPLGQLGQRPALHLFIGLGQLAAHRGRPVGPERARQIGQRLGQPVRRLEEDQRARLVGQLGRAARRRSPALRGRNPSKQNRSTGSPDTASAASTADGPGQHASPRARPRPRPPPAGSPGPTPTASRRRSPPARPGRRAAPRAAAAPGPPRCASKNDTTRPDGRTPRSAHSRCSRRVSSAAITGAVGQRVAQPGGGVGRVAQRGRRPSTTRPASHARRSLMRRPYDQPRDGDARGTRGARADRRRLDVADADDATRAARRRAGCRPRWQPWHDPHPLVGWGLTALVFAVACRHPVLGAGLPAQQEFDEVYYATEAQEMLRFGYEDNRGYMFIVHPPLGKWAIALSSCDLCGNNTPRLAGRPGGRRHRQRADHDPDRPGGCSTRTCSARSPGCCWRWTASRWCSRGWRCSTSSCRLFILAGFGALVHRPRSDARPAGLAGRGRGRPDRRRARRSARGRGGSSPAFMLGPGLRGEVVGAVVLRRVRDHVDDLGPRRVEVGRRALQLAQRRPPVVDLRDRLVPGRADHELPAQLAGLVRRRELLEPALGRHPLRRTASTCFGCPHPVRTGASCPTASARSATTPTAPTSSTRASTASTRTGPTRGAG